MVEHKGAILANSPLGYAESVIDLKPRLSGNWICWTHRPLPVAIAFFIMSAIYLTAMISLPFVLPGPGIDLVHASILIASCVPGVWVAFRGYRMWQWREQLRVDLANGLAEYAWARGGRETVVLQAPIADLEVAITAVHHRNGYKQIGVVAQLQRAHFAIYRGKSRTRAQEVLDGLRNDLRLPESVFAHPLPVFIKII
jgi:hypothetical protein